MTKIKFRAWDKANKVMMHSGFDIAYSGNICCYNDGEGKIHDPYELIPMQYTGLKDKNGKEIYEGDILHWESPDADSDGAKYEVVFKKSAFRIRWISKNNNTETYEILMSAYDLEVIGDIYENPELVTEA